MTDLTGGMGPKAWVDTGFGYKVSSIDELMRGVSRIGTLAAGRRYVWRGVPDSRYRISSSLVRALTEELGRPPSELELRERELALIRTARQWGVALDVPWGSDLHVLAQLQHHGIPTRLLDVTSNPITALWFACQRTSKTGDAAGALIAFDVTDLPEFQTVEPGGSGTYGGLADPLGWPLRVALNTAARDEAPFLVTPTIRDARMQAQEGLFLSGVVPLAASVPGMDGLHRPPGRLPTATTIKSLFGAAKGPGKPISLPMCVLVIPTTVKKPMRTHLESTYNRSRRVLFPDIGGMREAVEGDHIALQAPGPVVAAYDDLESFFPAAE
ncbi:MAG: FRG domain-containing protein [Candidatus Nanopelagicales bacterium]